MCPVLLAHQVYCMTRDDFETDTEWDAYLEEVESVVFDRVHGDADAQAQAKEKVRIIHFSTKFIRMMTVY